MYQNKVKKNQKKLNLNKFYFLNFKRLFILTELSLMMLVIPYFVFVCSTYGKMKLKLFKALDSRALILEPYSRV